MSFFTLPPLETWMWVALCCAAFCTGLSKTGISGIGIVSVTLFPLVLKDPREAVGSVLLLLIGADALAVLLYRRDAEWKYLWKLFPWTALGVFLGYLTMERLNGGDVKRLIGGILLFLVFFQIVQRIRTKKDETTAVAAAAAPLPPLYVSALIGILAGFTTMVANAAGPIMVLYLLSMRLPKIAFVGTAAWFFMALNWFKVPFGIALHTITLQSLALAVTLYPAAFLGGLLGRPLVKRIDQQAFEYIALALTFVGSLNLLR